MLHLYTGETQSTLSTFSTEICNALRSLSALSDGARGRACSALWSALKPATPTTYEQLQGLLSFESVVERFDRLCSRFELPFEAMVDLRLSFSRTLELTAHGGDDVAELSARLENLLVESGHEDTGPKSNAQPHFCRTFKQFHEEFAMLALGTWRMSQQESARLGILACRSTIDVVEPSGHHQESSWRRQFRLLGSSVTGLLEIITDTSSGSPSRDDFLDKLTTTEQVQLRRLGLLEIEIDALGRFVSSEANLLTNDSLNPLDSCLRNLASEVIHALSNITHNAEINSLGPPLLALLDEGTNSSALAEATAAIDRLSTTSDATLTWLLRGLTNVANYLRTTFSSQTTKVLRAASAWASFACSCLQLYVPETPFDPALEPYLRRYMHSRHQQDLSSRLAAIRIVRKALTGEESSLRAKHLTEDIAALGQEPSAVQICRPEVSQLSGVQSDLDGLMRMLQPVWQINGDYASFLPLDTLLLSNIDKIRSRLKDEYRSYDDFTAPVVGFVDCLLTAHRLADQAVSCTQRESKVLPLANIIPFAGASLDSWLQERSWVDAIDNDQTQAQQLLWLRTIAVRSSARPIVECSLELRQAVEQLFQRFYVRWRDELDEGQKRAAVKSSLYKFKGEDANQDEPILADLEQLFPSGEESPSGTTPTTKSLQSAQDLAQRIARLHCNIFAPQSVGQQTMQDLIREWLKTLRGVSMSNDKDCITPATSLTLGDLEAAFSSGSKQGHHYNMYVDSNIGEAKKLLGLVSKTTSRFRYLQRTWPEHATPVDVLRLCEDLLDVSHSSPLSKLLHRVEKLHATINEWQKIASREFSVDDVLQEITALIVGWRQLELSSWAGLFDREWEQCQRDAASWWYIAYETIVAASSNHHYSADQLRHHTEALLKTIGEFLASSGLGEFNARLDMLRGFEYHLASSGDKTPSMRLLHHGLANVIAFYSHFEQTVAETLTKGRSELEKEVNNIIQLASWKDRNIDVLRQSAQSSHKKLLRTVRKYRALLAWPAASIIQGGVPTQNDEEMFQMQTVSSSRNIHELDVHIYLPTLAVWETRPKRFRDASATAAMISKILGQVQSSLDGQQELRSYSSGLSKSISDLQKATPLVLTEETKAIVNHLKTRKRRLLADVLKDLRFMGFQTSMMSQQTLFEQASMEAIFARIPALHPDAVLRSNSPADYHFHRFLSLMPAVRTANRKHSDELTPAEIARCTNLLESMLQTSVSQRKSLASHLENLMVLNTAVDQLNNFGRCNAPEVRTTVTHNQDTQMFQLSCLERVMRLCIDILHVQQKFSESDYSGILQELETKDAEVAQLRVEIETLPQLPLNIQASGQVLLSTSWNKLTNEMRSVIETAIVSYPELRPAMSQLSRWIDREDARDSHLYVNGHTSERIDIWIGDLLRTLDMVLSSVQDVESTMVTKTDTKSNGWLLNQQEALDAMLKASRIGTITRRVSDLLSRLQSLELTEAMPLLSVAKICLNVSPIIDQYRRSITTLIEVSCSLYAQTNGTGFHLATSFIQLASHGFCTPSEKTQSNTQAGDVESGTGLGNGEGAEDISKNIKDDEDLSELAQDAKREDGRDDLEDEKDAVDMADEEMDGDAGDIEGSEAGDDKDAEGDADETTELDEEAGDVGEDEPSAVDENLWNGGEDESQQEKETKSGKGSTTNEDLTATSEQRLQGGSQSPAEETIDEAEADSEEAEQVEEQSLQNVDDHINEEENLDLPEDINMDGKKRDQDDDSEMDAISDEQQSEENAAQDAHIDDVETFDDDKSGLNGDKEDKQHEAEASHGDEEGDDKQDDEDRMSDVLMQEQQTTLDKPIGDTAFAEEGSGPDQYERNGQASQAQAGYQDMPNEDISDSTRQDTGEGTTGQPERGDDPRNGTHDHNDGQQGLPFKQLGDVLEQWYNQHRGIEDARENDGSRSPQQHDTDMANAQFEHLPDGDSKADTQVLGAASADQSRALDNENALPVNDNEDNMDMPLDDLSDGQERNVDSEIQEDRMELDPRESLHQSTQPASFVGEPRNADPLVQMEGDLVETETEEIEDVDEQLTNTHISNEDTPTDLSIGKARSLWSKHEESTRNLALILTEHLRLILQPTQATKMRGDFRTGKRLNIKRIIPYIASSYKRDKIWMRRSVPSKRSYQVMLAIDDSKSMAESRSQDLAFETLALVAKSMSMLDVGELCVVGFGEDVQVAHDFSTPFMYDAGAETCRQFSFSQGKTNVRRLLAESIELFRSARLKASSSASDLWQLQLIISDGICEDHPSIRQLVRQAHEERILIVFIVVDAATHKTQAIDAPKQSILDLQTAEFIKDAAGEQQLKMVKYLDTFPFRYYLIVRDVSDLPGVLAGALRQWFAEVVETSG